MRVHGVMLQQCGSSPWRCFRPLSENHATSEAPPLKVSTKKQLARFSGHISFSRCLHTAADPVVDLHFSPRDSRNTGSQLFLWRSSKRTVRGWTMLEMWWRLAGFASLCLIMMMYFSPKAGKFQFWPGGVVCLFLLCFKILGCFCSETGGVLLTSAGLDGRRPEFLCDLNIFISKSKPLYFKQNASYYMKYRAI